MRLLRYIAMAVLGLVAITSCEGGKEDIPAEAPVIILDGEATLTITSRENELELGYTIKNPVEGVELEASSDASWLSIFSTSTEGKVLLMAQANDDTRSRTATVTLQYATTKSYVRITQNAFGADIPRLTLTTEDSVVVDRNNRTFEIGYRVDLPTAEGYIYAFADQSWVSGFDTFTEGVVKVTVDPNYSGAERTAIVTVGYTHLRFEVALKQTAEGEVDFSAKILHGYYYGDQFSPGVGNYYLFLTDKGFNEMGSNMPNATFYRVDAYGPMRELENGYVTIPEGRYTFDTQNSYKEWTFSAELSCLYTSDKYGAGSEPKVPTEGEMVVESDRITLRMVINGETHTATYEGAPVLPDESASQMVYTTLSDDYQATLDDHTLYYANFGDYYDYGRLNWLLVIEPNDGSGDCFQIDVITASADAESGFAGDYTGSDVLAPSSFIPGWISGGYRESSWYYTADGTQQAPFRKGEVKITDNGDGTMGVTIDVTDDLKNRITASWSGTAIEVEPEIQSAVYRSSALRRR